MTPPVRFALLAASLLLLSRPAVAAVFCVGTSAELETALAAAETNGADDDVRLRSGVYPTTSAAGFTFEPSSPAYDDELTLSGGWNAVCDRFGGTSANTVLDAFGLGPVFRLEAPAGAVAIRRLTIRDANTTLPALGALEIDRSTGAAGPDVVIDRVLFTENVATSTLFVRSDGIVQILGCDFVHNTSTSGALWVNSSCSPGFTCAFVLANTIAGNAVSGSPLGGGAYLKVSAGSNLSVRNNIFWDNEAADVVFLSGGTYQFFHNIHGQIAGSGTVNAAENLQVDPQFMDPVGGDHRLMPTSPARDTADDGPSNLPLFDLLGVARPQDIWDRGAYEYLPPIFADGFESGDTTAWTSSTP